jgi:hypothetical protein
VSKFAERNGLTREKVTDEPGFVAEPTDQMSESIKELRRLAGLK